MGITGRIPRWLQTVAAVLAYVFVYVGLDSASYTHDLQNTEISPWSPNVAWMIVCVLRYGLRAAPLTILTPAIAEVLLRHATPFSLQALGAAGTIGIVYTAAGLAIRHWQHGRPQLTTRWLSLVLVVIASAALLDALMFSQALMAAGKLTAGSYLSAVRTGWVGDVNGVIVLLPLLMVLNSQKTIRPKDQPESPLMLGAKFVALSAAFWLAFYYTEDAHHDLFYLLFLPIIWIALRSGVTVTVFALGALQLGIVLLVAPRSTSESFLAVQQLMVLLAATGLYLGISTTEKRHLAAVISTHDSQLATLNAQMAVSEMHAATSHELNNPLTALFNYVRSAATLLDNPDSERGAVREVIGKAQNEAVRAVDVVGKLRMFYRTGEVRRESVDPRQLAHECVAALQSRMQFAGIACAVEVAQRAPPVNADSLQISMVIKNLLSNAIEALADTTARRRRISLRIAPAGREVEFHVVDSGEGMPEEIAAQLFRPLYSVKSSGMGLGLAICRALVEANEGRIWLVNSGPAGTDIAFSVPAMPA